MGSLSIVSKQVGAIIVRPNDNQMVIMERRGFENCCEDNEGLTRWDVLHAEANAIPASTQSHEGSTYHLVTMQRVQ
jgi:dCMP deaminase